MKMSFVSAISANLYRNFVPFGFVLVAPHERKLVVEKDGRERKVEGNVYIHERVYIRGKVMCHCRKRIQQ